MGGNYSLVVRNKDTNSVVYIPIGDKNNLKLSLIDKTTSSFKDEEQLLNRLYDNKYINFKNGDIFIIYQNNKMIKNIEVIYHDMGGVPLAVSNNNPSEIDFMNKYGNKLYNKLLVLLDNSDFRKKIYEDEHINSNLKEKIRNLYNAVSFEQSMFYKNEIQSILTKYREFRNMALYIDTYLKTLNNPNYEIDLKKKISERKEELNKKYPNGLTKENIIPSTVANLEYYDKVLEKEYKKIKEEESTSNIANTNLNLDNYNLSSDSDELNEMFDLDDISKMSSEEIENLGIRIDGLGKRR